MALTLLNLKIIVLFCFLILTFVFGMIPVIFVKFIQKISHQASTPESNPHQNAVRNERKIKLSRYKRCISYLSCYAAGVFLATCFLELLPNVQRNLQNILLNSASAFIGFPLAEFVMVFGLFTILVIEQIVLTIKERPSSEYSEIPSEEQPILNSVKQQSSSVIEEEGEINHLTESYQSQHSLGGICDEPHIFPNSSVAEGNEYTRESSENFPPEKKQRKPRYSREDSLDSHAPRHDHHRPHSVADHTLQTHSVLRAMLLLLALSLHSIFEGITVGLQTDKERVLSIFAALTLHKSILSFSLGMNLIQSKISIMSAIKSILGFSVASPVGVVIGIAITDLWTSTNSSIVHGFLQGIASGTFLYIIFFEILPKEFNCEVDRLLKVLCLIVGYATVTAILFLGDDAKEPLCKVVNDPD